MPITFEEARAFALGLPGVEEVSRWGRPALTVRKKAFLHRASEPGSFGVSADLYEVELLMEADPDAFWQSDHWKGWPGVLVRETAADKARVAALIEGAWRARASKAQKAERSSPY